MARAFVFRQDHVRVFPNAYTADPNKIGRELARIKKKHGQLTPINLEEEAKNPGNVLHQHLTWDNAAAARLWRQHEARAIIRCIVLIDDADDSVEPRRAWLSVRDDEGELHYHGLDEVLSSESLRLRVLERARADLAAWQARFNELREIVELVEPARARLEREIAKRRRKRPEDRPSV